MADHFSQLKLLRRTRDFLIGIDSDGCAFDTMEIKHKECFIPNIVNTWDLQAVSRFAREAAEFVNLYSRWRGTNRFPALTMVFDLLADWDEPVARGYQAPQVDSLRAWIKAETKLGNPALEAKAAQTGDLVLLRALAWSRAVNESIERIVRGVPPYPYVRQSLQKVQDAADMMVVSSTPREALQREWAEHGLDEYVGMLCGQEMGSKAEHLRYGACGKYDAGRILMIGDAPGDLRAAKDNGVLFYPINPGREADSWRRFHDEAADRFLAGEYAGSYEQGLLDAFLALLPETPPWKK